MNKYRVFKNKLENDFTLFSENNLFFAFSAEQVEKWLKKINTTEDKIVPIWGGWYLKADKIEEYKNFLSNNDKQYSEFLADEENLFDAFKYELWNHEFIISYDFDDALDALWLSYNELTPRQLEILKKAKDEYIANCD